MIPGQRGRGLVELLVAMAIGLGMTLGLFTIQVNSQLGARAQEGDASIADASRRAVGVVTRAIRHAGFQRQVFYDDTWMQTPPDDFRSIWACTGGFVDPSAAAPVCVGDESLPDAIVVRQGLEVVEANAGPTARTVRVDASRGIGVDCVGDTVPQPPTTAASDFVVENRYFIGVHPRTGRRELYCRGGANGVIQPVADGVEDMVLVFGVDRVGISGPRDLSVDERVRAHRVQPQEWNWADPTGTGGATRARRVLAVDVCLQVRSPERTAADRQTLVDCRGVSRTFSDGYTRQMVRTTIVPRNHMGGGS